MPEHIPPLDRLAGEAQSARGLSAAEVRRRGDRRRTTRRVTAGLATAAVVAAAGFGIWQSPLLDNAREPQWATTVSPTPTTSATEKPTTTPSQTPTHTPSPSPTSEAAADAPTWDNVPGLDIMYPYDTSLATVSGEWEGMGQAAKGLCDPGEWGNPTTTLVREFEAIDGPVSYAIVLGYADEQAAADGYQLIEDAARTCPTAQDPPHYVPADATTDWSAYISSVHPAENPDERMFNDTHLIKAGNRVLWRVNTYPGQDQNCSVIPGDVAGLCSYLLSANAATDKLIGR